MTNVSGHKPLALAMGLGRRTRVMFPGSNSMLKYCRLFENLDSRLGSVGLPKMKTAKHSQRALAVPSGWAAPASDGRRWDCQSTRGMAVPIPTREHHGSSIKEDLAWRRGHGSRTHLLGRAMESFHGASLEPPGISHGEAQIYINHRKWTSGGSAAGSCSTNHKDIGTLYLIFAGCAGLIGGVMSMAMHYQLMTLGSPLSGARPSGLFACRVGFWDARREGCAGHGLP